MLTLKFGHFFSCYLRTNCRYSIGVSPFSLILILSCLDNLVIKIASKFVLNLGVIS